MAINQGTNGTEGLAVGPTGQPKALPTSRGAYMELKKQLSDGDPRKTVTLSSLHVFHVFM